MKTYLTAALGSALLFATTAHAVEITGGSAQLSYSGFTTNTDVDKLSAEGSVELGFDRNIGAQLDLGLTKFGATDEDVQTIGVHGIYHVDEFTSLGAFYVNDNFNAGDADFYGIEAGHEMALWDFEGYLGRLDDSAADATLLGVSARYELQNGIGVTGALDHLNPEGVGDATRLGVKVDRDVIGSDVNLFLEVGAVRADVGGGSDTETYVGIGGKYVFGAERGATFEQRGLAKFLPGF
ncbi:hypothetical protein FIU94_15195 [Sulfitobacter sp. THAF37]|uniref:hypothetical protein n=1 Tax=Sulfitobacter sp. THAF37 TaxID=2587855 RepID=UPI00126883D7|nr:hypothetical protein [Sulfitobacter sp. THAF37]QFT60172.1 hypothetical protein FIU94_15195 [Sulfitobacter sp. THAF37]